MPDGIDHYHHHYHHYHHHYHNHHHNKDSHLLLRLHRRRQKRKRRRCGSRKCVDAEAEIIIIIIILSPTSTPRFPSDALGGLVVVGVPPLSAFLSPPRPLRCRSSSSFSLRGGLSRLVYKWCILAREGAVRSAPLVRSRQLSSNHQLPSN